MNNYLNKIIETKKFVHSYLFAGGEENLMYKEARELSKIMLCTNNSSKDLCNSCIKFDSFNHPDFMVIEPSGDNIKIEQVRRTCFKNFRKANSI